MINLYKKMATALLSIALFASLPQLTAGEAELKAANRLLDVMQFEVMMDNAINASIQMIEQSDPEMGKHKMVFKKFFEKYMSGESLRQGVAEMYAEFFTADEMGDIVGFYMTKTGQKSLKQLPEIMQRSMQLARTRAEQNMGELQKMIEEAACEK